MFWIGKVDVGWGQGCVFTNPFPPTPASENICYFPGGTSFDLAVWACQPYCDIVDGTIYDATITFGGDLTVVFNKPLKFVRCTLIFNENTKIKLVSEPQPGPFVKGAYCTFENTKLMKCATGGMWKGIEVGGNCVLNLKEDTEVADAITGVLALDKSSTLIEKTTFLDCNVGVNGNVGSGLDNNLSIKESTFDVLNHGILLQGKYKSLIIKDNSFNAGETGIMVVNLSQRNPPAHALEILDKNTFKNLDIGISVLGGTTPVSGGTTFQMNGVSIRNQIMHNCGYGIVLNGISPSGNNTNDVRIVGNVLNADNEGISLKNSVSSLICVLNQNIITTSQNSRNFGIHLKDNPVSRYTIRNNNIYNFNTGIRMNNIHHNFMDFQFNNFNSNSNGFVYINSSNTSQGISSFLINTNKFLNSDNLYLSSVSKVKLTANTFTKGYKAQNVNLLNASKLFIFESTFDGAFQNDHRLTVENGSTNSFCCNKIINNSNGILFSGTNDLTSLSVTTFDGSGLTLEESMIGPQIHTNNRWKSGTSSGTLIGAEPADNVFEIKLTQGNATDGQMKPFIIDPLDQANQWFVNDEFGNATATCANKCGLMLLPPDHDENDPTWVHPSDSIPNLGNCYPASLDRDGDGICDTSDPDPDNPCVPIGTDTDNDGICDVLDPAPNNACNPLSIDTDNDGICNDGDPDPYDPCIPNGIDTDGDGVCDNLDPFPSIPNPYIIPPDGPGGHTYSDGAGAPLKVEAYSSNGYVYSIASLEDIASRTIGSTDYDELNYVESMTSLYRILKTSPYLRIVSPKLNAAFHQLNNSSIAAYFDANDRMHGISKLNRSKELAIISKKLFINRLKNVYQKLDSKNTQDSIYTLLLDSIFSIQSMHMDKLLKQTDSIRNNKILSFANFVPSLPTDFNKHTALKAFYQVYISNILLRQPLNSAQISSTLAMANSCHLKYGEAVHRSRELLIGAELFDPNDFSSSCINIPSVRAKTESEISKIELYPNPTSGEIFLNIDNIEIIEVLDINGRLLKTYSASDISKSSLDLSIFNQSICLLKIRDKHGEMHHYKIIVIK